MSHPLRCLITVVLRRVDIFRSPTTSVIFCTIMLCYDILYSRKLLVFLLTSYSIGEDWLRHGCVKMKSITIYFSDVSISDNQHQMSLMYFLCLPFNQSHLRKSKTNLATFAGQFFVGDNDLTQRQNTQNRVIMRIKIFTITILYYYLSM